MKIVETSNWNRKEHFDFFSKMASPFFGIVTEVDCSHAYAMAQENGHSFFATYLHKSMISINSVKELKYRLLDNEVVEFDEVHAGATIARADGTFGFIFVPFSEDFDRFNAHLQDEIQAVQNSAGLRLNDDDRKLDLIRHSTFPWSHFSGLLHPTNFNSGESVPKITFGKFAFRDQRKYLPLSIEAHHGLADGYHLAQYLEEFQRQLNR